MRKKHLHAHTPDVPPRGLWLAGIYLRRNERCAGVVGTRTKWVFSNEEGGILSTTLLQYVAQLDGGSEIVGFRWEGHKESRPWCSLFVGFPSLFVAPRGERLALPMCWRGTSLSTISRVFVPIFLSGQSAVVNVEGVAFRSRAVVVWRGVVAGDTLISSKTYFNEK